MYNYSINQKTIYKHTQEKKMKDYLTLGSTPILEECQVSQTENYILKMREESRRYMDMLQRRFPIPEGLNVFFSIKKFSQYFGSYFEAVIYFDDEVEEELRFALFVEKFLPDRWEETEIFIRKI